MADDGNVKQKMKYFESMLFFVLKGVTERRNVATKVGLMNHSAIPQST